ncbi:MAG: ABC transporter permease [Ardenticatenaceae bacterium]|nr:ABC transporter permease [Ardenticatenaceae bacterium]
MDLLKFTLRRLLAIPITLFFITAVLYAIIMLAPAEERAMLYWPPRTRSDMPADQAEAKLNQIIEENGLNKSYPEQYFHWVSGLLRGDWGFSPVVNDDVLDVLLNRTPVTAELTLYSILFLIPLGLISGVVSGWRKGGRFDAQFRFAAFAATSIPPFILGLFLLSIFYVGLNWFPPGRTGITELAIKSRTTFQPITGMLTIDGLLNGRIDVTLDAFRHLVLPVFTLSLVHWATLGRVTRAAMINEKGKEYITAAYARGLRPYAVVWRHALRNAMLPALTSTMLSAASLVTSVFVIEKVFNLKGLSELITWGMNGTPDAPLALGFAVYSVLIVMPLMMLLDIIKAMIDPRVRESEYTG